MSETTEIKCDACGADLTYTGNFEGYRLVLASQSKMPWFCKEGLSGGVVTLMAVSPPLNRSHHFCDIRCLDHWRDRERHRAEQWRKWHEKWKTDHGRWGANGCISYPSPSEDLRKKAEHEFETAALAAFPMERLR